MIPTWYWLSRALHAISTQGKSDRTGTVAMVEFRLGHSTTAIVGPLCWSLQTESHAAMSCKIWKLHSDQFIKVLTTLKKSTCLAVNCVTSTAKNGSWDFTGTHSVFFVGAFQHLHCWQHTQPVQENKARDESAGALHIYVICRFFSAQNFRPSDKDWNGSQWHWSQECANKTHNCEGCY